MRVTKALQSPSKKRKIQRDAEHVDRIQQLENEITSAVANNASLNLLTDLLRLLFSLEDPLGSSKAIYALYRVFVIIITNGKLVFSGNNDAKVVKDWIWEKLSKYTDFLGSLLQDEEKFLRVSDHFMSADTLLIDPRRHQHYRLCFHY